MRAKLLKCFAMIGCFCLLLALGAACGGDKGDGVGGSDSSEVVQPMDDKIAFKTLTVDGTDVSGVVANEIDEFSFLEEIDQSGNAKYTVAKDKYGTETYAGKIVPLSSGDNTFYVFETLNGDIQTTYIVTIRRRPIHTVRFYLDNTMIHSISAEEGEYVEQPDITIMGYTLTDWNFDFSQPLLNTSTVDVSAELLPELSNFKVASTQTSCEITRVIDKSFSEIVIPDCVTAIGSEVFSYYEGLTSVTLGKNVTTIDYRAFQRCYDLKEIKNIENLTYVGSYAFEDCFNLTTKINLEKATYIGDYAFKDCSSITEAYIPETVTKIEANAFYNCAALTIYCQAEHALGTWSSRWANSYIGYIPVVWDCDNNDVADDEYIYTVVNGLRFGIIDGEVEVVKQATCLTLADLPSQIIYKDESYSVTSIGYDAFDGCSRLTSVWMPASVTRIGSEAFSGCYQLANIRYSGERDKLYSIKNKSYWSWENSVKATGIQCLDGYVTL